MIMIRVKYNSNTGQILGNYPPNINYPSLTIDEDNKTITDESGTFPYIEITEEQHQDGMGKNMVVIDGNYQEYVKTSAELLQEAKNTKLQKIEEIKQNSLYAPMSYNGRTFSTTEKANSNILGAILLDQTSYNWRDTSGNLVILNVADLKNLAALIAAQRGAVYNNEACKIIEVHNATTIEEVESITWQ